MALNKFYNKFNNDNTTQTIVSEYSGMIFKGLIFNGSNDNADIWLYIEDGGTLYKKTLSPNETFEFEPKIILENENLKLYSSKSNVESIIEILVN
jgi:hypothetical protein